MAKYEKRFEILYSAQSSNLTNSIDKAKNNKYLLDNISTWYIFEDEVRMGFSILRKYENLIRANVVEVSFEKKWLYRPEYCSFDLYGTTDLWYFIMFVNNIDTVASFDFEGKNILVPADELLDLFNNIIEKENRMQDTLKNPIRIYKHYLKRLDEPSKQVLPSNFDDELDGLTDLKEYEDITDSYLTESNYQHYTNGIIKGVLNTIFYEYFNRQMIKYKRDTLLTPNFYYIDDYSDEYYGTGFQKIHNPENDIIIEKNGYLRPFKTGNYKFRISSSADFSMFLDNKNVLNYQSEIHRTIPEMKYVKNLFEEYSHNSDFKRRNEDFWNIKKYESSKYSSPILTYNSTLNKTLLGIVIDKDNCQEIMNNNGKIYDIVIPISGIKDINFDGKVTFEDDGDIYYRIDYYLPLGKRTSKLQLKMEFLNNSDRIIKTVNGSSKSFNLKREPNKLCSEVIFIKSSDIKKSDISKVKLSLSLNFQTYEDSKENIYEYITISKVYFYTITNSYYETENSIYLDKDHAYEFKSTLQQVYDNPFTFFNLEYKFENEEYKKIPIGWFNVKAKEFNGYKDYEKESFKELKDYFNIDLDELFKIKLPSTKEEIFNDKLGYLKSFLLKSLISNPNIIDNTYSYFLNDMKHLIRMGIYDNDTNELLEEYYLDDFISNINILHEFNLSSSGNKKYRMSYELPLGNIRISKDTNKINIASYGDFNKNIKTINLKGNKEQRLNIYLTNNSNTSANIGNDKYYNSGLLVNKLSGYNLSSAERYLLLGTCNYQNSETSIDLYNLKDLEKPFEKFINNRYFTKNDTKLLCGCDKIIIDVITDGIHNSLSYDITVTEYDKSRENTYKYPLFENRVSKIQDIPDFFSKDYVEMLLNISWYNKTKDLQTEKNLLNFVTKEFFDRKLNEKYNMETFISNLLSYIDINTFIIDDSNIEKVFPFFSYDKGFKNEMLSSSIIYQPILPENNERYLLFDTLSKNKYVKYYLENYCKDLDFINGKGLYEGKFSEFLYTPNKNTIYKMLPETSLTDDFILYCKFKHKDYIHHENEQNIFNTKHGLFGIIFDYEYDNDEMNSYILLFNFNNNPKYLKTGFYKYNRSYPKNSYNGEGYNLLIDEMFKDRFKLIYEIKEKEFSFDLSHSDKKIMLMNTHGWIIVRVDGNKKSLIKFDENKIIPKGTAYKGGKLGFFNLNMDGIGIEMQLYN